MHGEELLVQSQKKPVRSSTLAKRKHRNGHDRRGCCRSPVCLAFTDAWCRWFKTQPLSPHASIHRRFEEKMVLRSICLQNWIESKVRFDAGTVCEYSCSKIAFLMVGSSFNCVCYGIILSQHNFAQKHIQTKYGPDSVHWEWMQGKNMEFRTQPHTFIPIHKMYFCAFCLINEN